jgi:hypothetical protein
MIILKALLDKSDLAVSMISAVLPFNIITH